MRRKGKGAWPIVLFFILVALVLGIYLFSKTVFVDKGVAVTPYACANGVNVVIVSDPYKANNYNGIIGGVKEAIKKGGSNASIVVVVGAFDMDKGTHIPDLFKGLSKLGLDGVYAYPTGDDAEDFSCEGVTNLCGETDTIDIREGGISSASVDVQRRACLLETRKSSNSDADQTLQIWDINEYTRRDVELSDATVKVLVGSDNKDKIACDVYIYVDGVSDEPSIMSALGGVGGEKASFNYEISASRVLVYCGTSGTQSTDTLATRHSIGVVEIASLDTEEDSNKVDSESEDTEEDKGDDEETSEE